MGQEDEHRLAYRVRRSGPEGIIFIPGLGASKSSFDTCFELASFRDYTLAAVDLPGCGESGPLDDFSYSMKDQADLVLKWIKGLGIAPTILVGHSMGGESSASALPRPWAHGLKGFSILKETLVVRIVSLAARLPPSPRMSLKSKDFSNSRDT